MNGNKISDNFERFNPYAAKAMESLKAWDIEEAAEPLAMLALAFEVSQLRFQLTKRLDNGTRKDQGSH